MLLRSEGGREEGRGRGEGRGREREGKEGEGRGRMIGKGYENFECRFSSADSAQQPVRDITIATGKKPKTPNKERDKIH